MLLTMGQVANGANLQPCKHWQVITFAGKPKAALVSVALLQNELSLQPQPLDVDEDHDSP